MENQRVRFDPALIDMESVNLYADATDQEGLPVEGATTKWSRGKLYLFPVSAKLSNIGSFRESVTYRIWPKAIRWLFMRAKQLR